MSEGADIRYCWRDQFEILAKWLHVLLISGDGRVYSHICLFSQIWLVKSQKMAASSSLFSFDIVRPHGR